MPRSSSSFTWAQEKWVGGQVKECILATLEDLGKKMVKSIKLSLKTRTAGSGGYRLWPSRRGRGLKHWSSRPGTAPSTDIGELRDSIYYEVTTRHNQKILIVGSYAPYAAHLEFGTMSTGWGGPIAPRPFIKPVFNRFKDHILETMSLQYNSRSKDYRGYIKVGAVLTTPMKYYYGSRRQFFPRG